MSTFKNPNGLWYARVSTGIKGPNGYYKYVTSSHGFKTKAEAVMDEAQLRLYVASGKNETMSKITVRELFDRYKASRNLRKTTLKTYNASINHIMDYLPDIPIRDVTAMHIETFRQQMIAKFGTAETVRTKFSLVKAAFGWAEDMDLILRSPARTIKLPAKKTARGLHIQMPVLQEILQIAKKYRYEQLYIPLLLAGFCGLRISEICGLQDTDVEKDRIHVRYNFVRAGSQPSLQPLKTAAAARTVPLIPFVAREVKAYRKMLARAKKEALRARMELEKHPGFLSNSSDPAWDGSHFFVFPNDGRPHAKEFVERHWKQFKQSLEMKDLVAAHPELARMRMHDFRHSFGSNLRYSGAPIEDVTELLGHTNSNFTRTTYALPLEGTQERSMKRFAALVKVPMNNFS